MKELSAEKKLKEKSFRLFKVGKPTRVIGYNIAIQICNEAIKQAKIEENEFHLKVFPSETSQVIFTKQVFTERIEQLEKKWKQAD